MTPQEALCWCERFEDNLVLADTRKPKIVLALQAIKECKTALEKQIPKKTMKRQYVPNGTLVYGHCPCCDEFTKNFFNYCRNCGQALDWSDTE